MHYLELSCFSFQNIFHFLLHVQPMAFYSLLPFWFEFRPALFLFGEVGWGSMCLFFDQILVCNNKPQGQALSADEARTSEKPLPDIEHLGTTQWSLVSPHRTWTLREGLMTLRQKLCCVPLLEKLRFCWLLSLPMYLVCKTLHWIKLPGTQPGIFVNKS